MEKFVNKYHESYKNLDQYQKEFVDNQSQIIKCLANAGSGKTHSSIVKIIDYALNKKILPEDIVLISYTTKASKLLRERYSSFFELNETITEKTPFISTIHSFCFKLFNDKYKQSHPSSSYTILNDYKNFILLKEIVTSNLEQYLGLSEISLEKNIIYSIYYLINDIANACEIPFFLSLSFSEEALLSSIENSPDLESSKYSYSYSRTIVNGFNSNISETINEKRKEYFLKFNSIISNTKKIDETHLHRLSFDSLSNLFCSIIYDFTKSKLKLRKLSFSDIIYYTFLYNKQYKTLGSNFKVCMVDEAQDLDYINFSVFRSLVDNFNCRLILVGDPKQSLYSFRLADPDILDKLDLFFPLKNVSTNYLLSNYRSNQNLVKLSNGFSKTLEYAFDVQDSVSIKEKEKNSFIFKPFDFPEQEYDYITTDIQQRKGDHNYSDFSVIARTNSALQEIEPFFIKHKIPYKIKYDSRSFFNQSSFKFFYNIYSILLSNNDIDSLLEILENFRGIGEKTLKKIRAQFISKLESDSKYSLFSSDFVQSLSSNSLISSVYKLFLIPLKEFFNSYEFTILSLHKKIHYLVRTSFRYLEQTDDNIVKYSDQTNNDIYLQMTLDQIDKACSTINSLYDSYIIDQFFKNMIEIERMYEIYNALSTTQVDKNNDTKDCVILSTIHSFKGMESDIVYFFNTSSLAPFKADDKINDLCCMYVAVTRAKSKLIVTSPRQLRTFDRQLRKSIFNPYLNYYLDEVKKLI